MTETNADRMRRFLGAVCDALASADPDASWPEWRPATRRLVAAPLLVGVAVSTTGCQRAMGVKYAGPPPPDDPGEVESRRPVDPGPPSTQPPPASFPGASASPPTGTGATPEPTAAPDPTPPDLVVKYGAPPPVDAVPKYGIPIEALPVEPPPSEPLPGQKYGMPPPGAVETRYGVPF
jgi:hypothetical protein